MSQAPRHYATLALLASLGALLAGCNSGSGYEAPTAPAPPPPAATHDVPATALTSLAALVQFLRSLAPSDTGQPLRVEGVVLPVSDTAEPIDLGGA